MWKKEKDITLGAHPGLAKIINQFNPNDFIYIIKALYLNSVQPKFCDRKVILTTSKQIQ